ncbi:MAG: hypothetical protein K5905_23795 [Roseibium sp.]|uniref:hypothetical protein n=1 Tax=Roseibium sp. TaxID=1936156 RepID=UPI00260A5543|nr:hypothetical protein [Roseibium sp.]MCV0428493.1 hypothetical protein [Roseibium sp.]
MISFDSMPVIPPGGSARDVAVSNLTAQVQAGEISAGDQDAILEALDAMHAERAENAPAPGTPPPSKEEVQAKFESLLSDQVDAGTLSQEQADHMTEMIENGELGRPKGPPPANGIPPEMMGELMSAVLEQLQSGSVYTDQGDKSSSSVGSMLADFKV